MKYRVDLHTHSTASPDGALTERDYRTMLEAGLLDYIAITDHNTTDFARHLHDTLGERIIIGEEIRTTHGEIIGLYLKETIPKLMSPKATIDAIRQQGGLVCIPHPFENIRRGMQVTELDKIAERVDMIEVHNGRAVFQNKSKQAYAWAARHGCRGVASSDCHAPSGWGKTYTLVSQAPNRGNLLQLLETAEYVIGFPGVKAVLYPKFNKLSGRLLAYRRLGKRND